MFNRTLASYVPTVYKDIVEMDTIIESEQILIDEHDIEALQAFNNTFVLRADEKGIQMFEFMLNIVASPATEDLEFRRQRVLNRMSMSPPFTFRFLKKKLNEIIGEGRWEASVDFNNFTLYIESSAVSQNWHTELEFTITQIKPCNIIFTNVPRTDISMRLTEEISVRTMNWNYLLGHWSLGFKPFASISGSKVLEWYYKLGSWSLGDTPFALTEGGVIIKMEDIKSIKDALIEDTADFVLSDIHSVLINDTVEITDFRVSAVVRNIVTLEYEVTPAMCSEIENIKLLKGDGTVLTESQVYVPVTATVLSKHNIKIKEG